MHSLNSILTVLVGLITVGLFASVLQTIVTYKVKDNVKLEYAQMGLRVAIITVGAIFIEEIIEIPRDFSYITSTCQSHVQMTPD